MIALADGPTRPACAPPSFQAPTPAAATTKAAIKAPHRARFETFGMFGSPSARAGRNHQLLSLAEDVEPLLKRLRQPQLHLVRIAAGPVAVLRRHAVGVAVLR